MAAKTKNKKDNLLAKILFSLGVITVLLAAFFIANPGDNQVADNREQRSRNKR